MGPVARWQSVGEPESQYRSHRFEKWNVALVGSWAAGADIKPALPTAENCLMESRIARRQSAGFVGIFIPV